MPGPPDDIPLCWCCQSPLQSGRARVWLTSDLSLPICSPCWNEIPKHNRAELAIKFRDRGESATRIADALDALVRMIEQSTGFPLVDLYDQPDELN